MTHFWLWFANLPANTRVRTPYISIGATTAIWTRSGITVIEATRAPPCEWIGPMTNSSQPAITKSGAETLRFSSPVIDLNSRREFNYYRKTSVVFIIEELWASLKVTSFALITGSSQGLLQLQAWVSANGVLKDLIKVYLHFVDTQA